MDVLAAHDEGDAWPRARDRGVSTWSGQARRATTANSVASGSNGSPATLAYVSTIARPLAANSAASVSGLKYCSQSCTVLTRPYSTMVCLSSATFVSSYVCVTVNTCCRTGDQNSPERCTS